jgi:NitT/TauT family transport system ATP-binding protein
MEAGMSDIILSGIAKSYGNKKVLENLHMTLRGGRIASVLGVSGIGKSTLLNIIGGLTSYEGKLEGVPKEISYIFQNPALAPNLTVKGNLEFVLRAKIAAKSERKRLIEEVLHEVGMSEESDKYPYELSTGMAQRVSMARAFVYPSGLIMMDEPFRGLDIATKAKLMKHLLALWKVSGRTVLIVTHSVDEAVLLSDDIFVLGGSPAAVTESFSLDSDKMSRKLSDEDAAAVFRKLYEAFSTEK